MIFTIPDHEKIKLINSYSFNTDLLKKNEDPVNVNFVLRMSPNYYKVVEIYVNNINYLLESKDSPIDTDDDWDVPTSSNPGEYFQELLSNKNETVIGSGEIVPGKISRILISLGSNSIWRELSYAPYSASYNLKVPYVYADLLNFETNVTIEPGIENNVFIEFDAKESVYFSNNEYLMNPHFRAYTDKTTGNVEGYISPKEARPFIYVVSANDTISTISEKSDGYFRVRGISAGNYQLSFKPLKGYSEITKDIEIANGKTINVGSISF